MCVASMVAWTQIHAVKGLKKGRIRELNKSFIHWEASSTWLQKVRQAIEQKIRKDRPYFSVRSRVLIVRLVSYPERTAWEAMSQTKEESLGHLLIKPVSHCSLIYFNFKSSWNLHVQNLLPIICIHCFHKTVHSIAQFLLFHLAFSPAPHPTSANTLLFYGDCIRSEEKTIIQKRSLQEI